MFTLSWTDIKSAIISTILTAIGAGLAYIIGVGNIFGLDFHALTNVVAMSLSVGIVSLIKQFFTTRSGDFVGAVRIRD